MRLLITGSRDIPAEKRHTVQMKIWEVYLTMKERDEALLVVHGDCPSGADHWARLMVEMAVESGMRGIGQERHPANWNGTDGRAAGFVRNQEMVDLGADQCVAFKLRGAGNKGTSHCAGRAAAAGIPVEEIWVEP